MGCKCSPYVGEGLMLVTLATSQSIGANGSATYSYSPNSVQKVFVRMQDEHAEDARITVQIGSTTICNGASAYGLFGLTQLSSGHSGSLAAATGILNDLDFGNHECDSQDNLYVTIQAGGDALSAVDVSAIVDTPGMVGPPLKLTEYSDNTFTSSNNLSAICWDSAKAVIDGDAYNCEIRTSISSSAPSFISAVSYYQASLVAGTYAERFGLLNVNSVPLSTTYNYSSSAVTDSILTIEQMGQSAKQTAQAKQSGRLALSQAGK